MKAGIHAIMDPLVYHCSTGKEIPFVIYFSSSLIDVTLDFYVVCSYLCLCADGYNGEHCEHEILECLSSPCINGGECNEGTNSFSCDCPSGYSGFLCEIERDPCSDIHCYNGKSSVVS